jgi:rhodanese-related sulfurtransferase
MRLLLLLAGVAGLLPMTGQTADPKPQEGWYPQLVQADFVKNYAVLPKVDGVMIIDSRPTRTYEPGHIPTAVNIPDSKFDEMTGKLPKDKATLLIFYCGGVDCMLSHKSAFRAEKLGYSNVRVYAAGMPDWVAKGQMQSVSGAYIKKLIDEKANAILIDARPKRVFDKGAIPTAVNIPDSEFDKHVDKLPKDKATPLIFYCGGLECVLSNKSADKARQLGYTDIKTYPEGYPDWSKTYANAAAGNPAAAIVAGKEKGTMTVASFEGLMKGSPGALLVVDVRDPKEFAAGNIKGSVNIPINELSKKLDTLPKDKPIVFVCGTGGRSGEAYDTVKLLRADLQAYFLDADIKFNADGTYVIKEHGK